MSPPPQAGVEPLIEVTASETASNRLASRDRGKRIAIFVVTYNAVTTLSKVLDRIPNEVWDRVEEVFVFDDESQDSTLRVRTDHHRAAARRCRNPGQWKRPITMKMSPLSSHVQLLDMVGPTPRTILDVGCSQGEFAHTLKQRGHYVFGIDRVEPTFEMDGFVRADLWQGLPPEPRRTFDLIILADVLEHMVDPIKLLLETKERLAPGEALLVSLPNAVHWSVRMQIAVGRFEYANKGILDRGHVRFFTLASAERMFAEAGLRSTQHRTTPVPWGKVIPRAFGRYATGPLERIDYFFSRLRPNISAYQHVFRLVTADEADTDGVQHFAKKV